MIEDRIVGSLADHLVSTRERLVAACRDNPDIGSLTRWMAHEAADALWAARNFLTSTPRVAIWRPADPVFLLAAEPAPPTTPPAPNEGDLWIDVVAVPSSSKADTAAKALAAGRMRFARLRESRHAGMFAIVAVVVIRGDDDLSTIDRLHAELGDPAARERFGGIAGPWGMVVDVLSWRV